MAARGKKRVDAFAQPPLPIFEPQTDWVPPALSDLPAWEGARRVSVDVENKDEDLKALGPGVRRADSYIAGYSFAIEDGPAFYVPLRHGGGGNVDAAQGVAYLRSEAAKFTGDIVGMNLGYDLDWLLEEGVEFKAARSFRDIQIAAVLCNELHDSYSMESIAGRLGLPGKDETILQEALSLYGYTGTRAKRGIWALPAKFVGDYGIQDSRIPLQALNRFERQIDEQKLWDVWNLESELLPVTVEMRRHGVRIDETKLAQVNDYMRVEGQAACLEIARLTGVGLLFEEITKPEPKARVLRSIGIEPPLTPKTGKPSISKEFLATIQHPAAALLRRASKMAHHRSSFCESMMRFSIKGRIHASFNQVKRTDDSEEIDENEGVGYGRMSCTMPNLQQQPAPDRDPELGTMWRAIFLPDEGGIWATHDYKQQEPVMAVHLALRAGARHIGEAAYKSALKAADAWRSDPKADFHDMMTRIVHGEDIYDRVGKDQFKLLRRFCKEIFLGLSYGMGGAKLCRKLGLPTVWMEKRDGHKIEVAGPEGQVIIDKFNGGVPFVKQVATVAQNRAKAVGYVTTIGGRRCRFPKDEAGNYDWVHKAFNRLDQGSSADQTKRALVEVRRAGFRPQLQVHDEIDLTMSSPNREVAEIMEHCVELLLPMRVDVETGPSWGEAK